MSFLSKPLTLARANVVTPICLHSHSYALAAEGHVLSVGHSRPGNQEVSSNSLIWETYREHCNFYGNPRRMLLHKK